MGCNESQEVKPHSQQGQASGVKSNEPMKESELKKTGMR